MGTASPFKRTRRKLTALTAYDAPTASILADAGVDIVLVGDSLATVILGYKSTRDVSMDAMIHHASAVRRGAPKAYIVSDMPFESVNGSISYAVKCAQRFISDAGSDAVKIEWAKNTPDIVEAVIKSKIPVIGHAGLTPQTADKTGGFRVRGKSTLEAFDVYKASKHFESLGALSVVLECIPAQLAQKITNDLSIPTIGIGAGAHVSGQILVLQDIVGLSTNVKVRFAPRYADFNALYKKAVKRFVQEVRSERFPKPKHSF